MYIAKAVYACVMAAITALLAIYTDNVLLIVLAAALTPLGVYLVPNTGKPSTTVDNSVL